jgi:hypothetical protein
MMLRNTLLGHFVHIYLEQCEELAWNATAFEVAVRTLRAFLETPKELLVTTAIFGLDLHGDVLQIGPDMRIERLDIAGKQNLFEMEQQFYGIGPHEAMQTSFTAFVVEQSVPATSWASQSEAQRRLERLVTALRLLGAGRVQSGIYWSRPNGTWFGLGGGSSRGGAGTVLHGNAARVLSCDETTQQEILDLIDLVAAPRDDEGLALALRRFGYAHDRRLDEDRLIDYWIGLEALYTTSGENQETVDKISRRIARLLGTDQRSRIDLKEEAKTLYNIRSRVVHGGSPSQKGLPIEGATLRTEHLLRQSIRRRLEMDWNVDGLEDQMMA